MGRGWRWRWEGRGQRRGSALGLNLGLWGASAESVKMEVAGADAGRGMVSKKRPKVAREELVTAFSLPALKRLPSY